MSTFGQRVAEAIMNDAQSGSAVWDELNGPSAVISQHGEPDNPKFVITIPQEYDEQDQPTDHVCLITVEYGAP